MPRYKLLALDMDGTLLTSDKRISDRTLSALGQAADAGVAIALCTGRALNELAEYRTAFRGLVRYATLVSGAQAIDLDEELTFEAHPLDTADALAIANRGLAVNAMIHVLTTATTAAKDSDFDRMDQVGMGIYQEMFRRVCTPVADIRDFITRHEGEVCKVNLYHLDQATRTETRSWAQNRGLTALPAELTSLEFTRPGVSKAVGIRALCRHLNCTTEQCVAVGDSFNDIDALQAVGLAIAMGNAPDEVKALAHATVADNDHDGIVEVVARFLQ